MKRYLKFFFKTAKYFINLVVAIVFVKVVNILNINWKNNVWVIGGAGGKYYNDNGSTMHQYILENHPEIEIYWVINKNSLDVEKVKDKGPVLYKHSLKANIYALVSKVMICTHTIRGDIIRIKYEFLKKTIKVKLFHGITAFKSKNDPSKYNYYDLLIATSEYEKKIKSSLIDNKSKICVSGFPRYDILYKNLNKKIRENKIFYMPTWRPWLTKKWIEPGEKDNKEFRNSYFYNEILEFLTSKKLNDILYKNNYKLEVYLHQNIHLYANEIIEKKYPSNIEVLPKNTNVQGKLINSNILITDYSSIAWDSLFLNKSIVFYQFDYKKYKNYYDSYIDMEKDLFGPITESSKETTHYIKKIIEDNYKYSIKKRNLAKNRLIKYEDSKNCKRIMDCIKEKIIDN